MPSRPPLVSLVRFFPRPLTAITCGLQVTTVNQTLQGLGARNMQIAMAHDQPDPRNRTSALDAALERVADRWSLLVVEALLEGPRRFNELLADVPGIAPNILSQRL